MVDDVYNTDPRPLNRKELAEFLPSQRAIRAFEKLFALVPQDFIDQQLAIDAVDLLASVADAKGQLAIDAINRLSDAVESLALSRPQTALDDDFNDVEPKPQHMDEIAVADDVAPRPNVDSIEGELSDITTHLLRSSETLANGAAGNAGTLTNAPVAGDPTKWVSIDDNGTTRYLPAW